MSLFLFYLSIFSGVGIYLHWMSRLISHIDDSYAKTIFAPLLFLAVVGGFSIFGWLVGSSPWAFALLVPLGWLLLSGFGLWIDRRRTRASQPISQSGPALSWRHPLTTTALQCCRYRLQLPAWGARDMRIAFISDLHLADTLPFAYYQGAIEHANSEQPDLVLLGGDYLTEARYAQALPRLLSMIDSRLGVYAVLGNHDYWTGAAPVIEALRQCGIHILHNGWQRLPVGDGYSLLLTGCEAPWNKDSWSAPPKQQGEICLALSHTGDTIYQLNHWGADIVFSGHYHAGQWHLPGLGPLVVPSAYGRRFEHGHFLVNGTHLFVSAGVGSGNPALRLYCRPDILIVDLCSSK